VPTCTRSDRLHIRKLAMEQPKLWVDGRTHVGMPTTFLIDNALPLLLGTTSSCSMEED
jgi:hypothetical protein